MKTETELDKIYDEIFRENIIIEIEYALTNKTSNEDVQTLIFNPYAAEVDYSSINEQVLCLHYDDQNTFEEDKFKLLQLMAEKFQNGYDSEVRINQYYNHPSMLLKNIYVIKPKQTVYLLDKIKFFYCDINSVDDENLKGEPENDKSK